MIPNNNGGSGEVVYLHYNINLYIPAFKEKPSNSSRFQILSNGHKTPLHYCLSDRSEWLEFQENSVKIFSMAPSSAASERNF